jgi:hypothetical protein
MQICVNTISADHVLEYSTLFLDTCKIKSFTPSKQLSVYCSMPLIQSNHIFQHYNAIIVLENILYTNKNTNIV